MPPKRKNSRTTQASTTRRTRAETRKRDEQQTSSQSEEQQKQREEEEEKKRREEEEEKKRMEEEEEKKRREEAEKKSMDRRLTWLRSKIIHRPPYCQGTIAVTNGSLNLFYGKPGDAHCIDLCAATADELQHLADTCTPATFGVNQEDVLDETYRKAGKLDASQFAFRFDPETSGLLNMVRSELAEEGRLTEDSIRAELYKLNVYGEGSFFKAHVDTPRSETMFGSLVIVFPTPHEGGELALRVHREKKESQEWIFDSTDLLAGKNEPAIAYVAFYSDIEHEVLPVLSGHRVTITYNLYHVKQSEEPSAPPATTPMPTNETSFKEAMDLMLADPKFVPRGGHLIISLRHKYPLPTDCSAEEGRKALVNVAAYLKATDAVVWKVLRDLGLDASLRITYMAQENQWSSLEDYILCDRPVVFDKEFAITDLFGYLEREAGGHLVPRPWGTRPSHWEGAKDPLEAYWVTTRFDAHHSEAKFMAYGNEASLETAYWHICILVRVGPPGQRRTIIRHARTRPGASRTRD